MAQRSHVPKFGNWENEQDVPYTAYFDKARKGRTGTKMINPNDPEENQDGDDDDSSNARAPPPKVKPEPEEVVNREGPGRTKEEGAVRQFAESPARNDNVGRRASGDQHYAGRGTSSADAPRRPAGRSVGSEQSVEKSPLHPHARVYGRGTGTSPSSEGKGSYETSRGTPGRSRMRPTTRGDESPEKSAAVPKFGEWDENNPASADGYTHIFNKVREERQNGGGKVPDMTEASYNNPRKPAPNSGSKICCFPWGRK